MKNGHILHICLVASYLIILVFPGIVAWPVDHILHGNRQVDGWTIGVDVWYYSVIALPIVYLIFIVYYFLRKIRVKANQ